MNTQSLKPNTSKKVQMAHVNNFISSINNFISLDFNIVGLGHGRMHHTATITTNFSKKSITYKVYL